MRRTFTLLASVALAMLLVSGAAWAANQIRCPNGEGEPCVGTGRADEIGGTRGADDIRALGGADVVRGGGGDDEVRGGSGADRIGFGFPCGSTETFAGGGDDVINVADRCTYQGGPPPPEVIGDYVDCGPGRDVVRNVGRGDEIAEDCERKTKE